jgi:two-component system uhpT operon response regulator UhpA
MHGKKCLLVDDDALFAMRAERQLSSAGMRTARVGGSVDALRELSRATWDAVIVDLQLPDAGGLGVVRHAMKRAACAPAILATSSGGELLAHLYRDGLAVPIVPKARLLHALVPWVFAVMSDAYARDPPPPEHDGRIDSRADAALRKPFSAREDAIFSRLACGHAPKEIAHDLGISHATVRAHARNAYQKLGATSLREALAILYPR